MIRGSVSLQAPLPVPTACVRKNFCARFTYAMLQPVVMALFIYACDVIRSRNPESTANLHGCGVELNEKFQVQRRHQDAEEGRKGWIRSKKGCPPHSHLPGESTICEARRGMASTPVSCGYLLDSQKPHPHPLQLAEVSPSFHRYLHPLLNLETSIAFVAPSTAYRGLHFEILLSLLTSKTSLNS